MDGINRISLPIALCFWLENLVSWILPTDSTAPTSTVQSGKETQGQPAKGSGGPDSTVEPQTRATTSFMARGDGSSPEQPTLLPPLPTAPVHLNDHIHQGQDLVVRPGKKTQGQPAKGFGGNNRLESMVSLRPQSPSRATAPPLVRGDNVTTFRSAPGKAAIGVRSFGSDNRRGPFKLPPPPLPIAPAVGRIRKGEDLVIQRGKETAEETGRNKAPESKAEPQSPSTTSTPLAPSDNCASFGSDPGPSPSLSPIALTFYHIEQSDNHQWFKLISELVWTIQVGSLVPVLARF
jgi:hypothetical protein